METVAQMTVALRRFNLNRQRFLMRTHFFTKCLDDITTDFHKQYGSFYLDWEATAEACAEYIEATDDYLRSRDIIAIEFALLLGTIETAQTAYAQKKAVKKFKELMEICQSNDAVTIAEIDEDIDNVRSVYRMIAVAECERED